MTSAGLFRLSGVFLILGSFIFIIAAILVFFVDTNFTAPIRTFETPLWGTFYTLIFVAEMLLLIGLPALYLSQAEGRGGKSGLIGVLLFAISILFGITIIAYFVSILPLLAQKAPDVIRDGFESSIAIFPLGSMFLGLIGSIMLGISIIRAKVFPSFVGILILLFGVLNFATIFTSESIYPTINFLCFAAAGIGFGSVGVILIKQR